MSNITTNIDNPSSYKKCQKKLYQIWACMPPKGTIVINKLEQAALVRKYNGKTFFTCSELNKLKLSNPAVFNSLAADVRNKFIYVVDITNCVVLSGTRGELWTITLDKLLRSYNIFIDGQACAINDNILAKRSDSDTQHYLEDKQSGRLTFQWTKVQSKPDSSNTFACFVPKAQKGQIQVWGGNILNFNAPYVEHGKGDFILCPNMNGHPDLANRWVVNGAVFADTYNNQGWIDCIEPSSGLNTASQPVELYKKVSSSDNKIFSQDLYNFVGSLAQKCAETQHHELPMRVRKGDSNNTIVIDCKTILDFNKHNSTKELQVSQVRTVIEVKPNNSLEFKNYLADNVKIHGATNYVFTIPNRDIADNETVDVNEVKSYLYHNFEIIFGLCGYCKEIGIKDSFSSLAPFTKGDYDGIRDYTMTSGATNRICRGMSYTGYINKTTSTEQVYGSEQKGEGLASPLRTVMNCDSFFDKSLTCRPIKVFRGQPCDNFFHSFTTYEGIEGTTAVNTAYTSTSLNMQSTPLFASAGSYNDKPVTQGIIYAIDLPINTRANYIHNVAGWVQQFEILLDRCYDIKVDKTLLQFKDNAGHTFKVVQGQLIQHTPNQVLDPVQSSYLYKKNITNYDEFGKIPIDKQYSNGVLHEAFNLIRKKGFSDVQWQEAYNSLSAVHTGLNKKWDNEITDNELAESGVAIKVDSCIILRQKNDDINTTEDIAFCLEKNLDTSFLNIHKIQADRAVQQNHSNAKDLRWSLYGIDAGLWYGKTNKNDDNEVEAVHGDLGYNFNQKLYNTSGDNKHSRLLLKEATAEEIAKRIIDYAKIHKNICLLPLIDVARYFDMVFTQVLEQEGYQLLRTIRVERVLPKDSSGNISLKAQQDPQAGYVPCKYLISGDNDDHLTIMVKFERDKANNKLCISFRGRSEGNSVNESKDLRTDIFDDGKMYRLAQNIIYLFAKKMHLSKARKFDQLINYFCLQTGCKSVRCPVQNNSLKSYKIWAKDMKSNLLVDINRTDIELYNASITLPDGNITSIDFDTTNTIFELYQRFCSGLVNNTSQVG